MTDQPQEPLRSVHTTNFPAILEQLGISLVVSTYQAGRLVLLRADEGKINTHFRLFNRPMGVAADRERLTVGTAAQIWYMRNIPAVSQKLTPPNKHDACYVPRDIHVTGDVDMHEMAWGDELPSPLSPNGGKGRGSRTSSPPLNPPQRGGSRTPSPPGGGGKVLWFVNTKFSCLCNVDHEHSFLPRWRPPFVTALALEDRCHLNGLAFKTIESPGAAVSNNVTVNGLTIKGAQGTSKHGISASGEIIVTNSVITGSFYIGVVSSGGSITVTNSVITGSFYIGVVSSGGSITVTNSVITGSFYIGVVSSGGSITVTNSTISGNGRSGIDARKNVSVSNSTISGNTFDGVINSYFAGVNISVSNSTVSGNGRNGVSSMSANGNVSVVNSTLSGNTFDGVNAGGSITVTNSTLSNNNRHGVAAGKNTTVTNSTLSGNANAGVKGGNAVITLNNSLIVGNTGSDVDCSMVGATLTTNGKNLIMTQNGAACTMPTEITALAVAAIMGPLANNGGSTQTHALVAAATNPAVNKGDNADAPGATDQRGQARIQGGTVDIGAFESAFVEVAKAVGGVAEFITPPAVNDGLMWRTLGVMGAGLAMGLGVLGLSQAKKTE